MPLDSTDLPIISLGMGTYCEVLEDLIWKVTQDDDLEKSTKECILRQFNAQLEDSKKVLAKLDKYFDDRSDD